MKNNILIIGLIAFCLNKVPEQSCHFLESLSSVLSSQYTNQCVNRPLNGYICVGCDVLAVCVKRNDKWETIPVTLCDTAEGYSCNTIEGTCSNKTGPCNPVNNGAFTCTSVGTFPDPYDCQLYHVCYMNGNNIISADINCKLGTAYNALTGDCSLTLNAAVCHHYGFTCKKAGDIDSWLYNPNIFYICKTGYEVEKIIYPELYKCDPDEIFVKDECIKNNITTTTASPPVLDFECQYPGIYADTTSCLHYIYCNKTLFAERFKCPESTYFNQEYLSCTLGVC